MTQQTVIEVIKDMPQNFNIDELIERLIIVDKINEAEKDVREGRVHTHAQVLKMTEEWKK